MDGETFDALVQHALGNGSRRGVLRAGIGVLAATALTAFGLNAAEDVHAKKHKKKGKKKEEEATATATATATAAGEQLHDRGRTDDVPIGPSLL